MPPGDGVTPLGVLDTSLLSKGTTLSPDPKSRGQVDERQCFFAASIVHPATSLLLLAQRRDQLAKSLS
jgi:hypothetical protein